MQINFLLGPGIMLTPDWLVLLIRIIIFAVFLALYVFQNKYEPSIIISMFVVILLGLYNQNEYILNFAYIILIMGVMKNYTVSFNCNIIFFSCLLYSIILFPIILHGYVTNASVYEPLTGRVRNTLGFRYAYFAGLFCFSIFLSYYFIIGKIEVGKFKKIIIYSSMAFCLVAMSWADSRAPLYCIILGIIADIFFRNRLLLIIVSKILPFLPLFLLFLSYYIAISYDYKTNDILSGRPYLYSLFVNQITWVDALFGTSLSFLQYPLDNSYFIFMSALGFLFVIPLFIIIKKHFSKYVDRREVIFILITLIYGFSEVIVVKIEILSVILFYLILLGNPIKQKKSQ
jgi:hypothetical protein